MSAIIVSRSSGSAACAGEIAMKNPARRTATVWRNIRAQWHDACIGPRGGAPMRNVDPQEWEARCDLAAAYRLIAHFGMDDLIFTHLSMRIPGEGHRFLLNPYGYLFDEITASSLVAVDPDGHAIESEDEAKINNAGFTIHSAVHMSRDDAHCVMHTHTTAGMAVAAQEQGLLPLNQMSMQFFGRTSYHDYEGIALDLDERERLVRDLGDTDAM